MIVTLYVNNKNNDPTYQTTDFLHVTTISLSILITIFGRYCALKDKKKEGRTRLTYYNHIG